MQISRFFPRSKDKLWQQVSASDWQKTASPWNLGSEEVRIYNQLFSSIKAEDKVAVLGCTPLIRSMLLTRKCQVDVIDSSVHMYLEMSKLSTYNPSENFYERDWIEYFSSAPPYNYIIGDLVVRLVETKSLHVFFRYLSKSLKPNGKLILRIHLAEKQFNSVDAIIRSYAVRKLNLNFLIDALFFPLSELFVNQDGLIQQQQMYLCLKQNNQSPMILAFLAKWEKLPLPPIYARSEVGLSLQEYFSVLQTMVVPLPGYPSIYFKVFCNNGRSAT